MIRFSKFYLGLDCGVSSHPSALTVLRRAAPLAGEDTPGPVLEIIDMARVKGCPFTQVATEVRKVLVALDGDVTIGVDATGPGAGLTQELRRQGVRCVAVTISGNSNRIIARGDRWTVPSSQVYESVHRLLVQRRLRANPDHPLARQLTRELDACTVTYTPSGGVKYEVLAHGSHGDLLVSTGLAAVLHEHPHARVVNVRERRGRPGYRERRAGTPRRGGAARQLIRQRLEESERAAEDRSGLSAPMGIYRAIYEDSDVEGY